MLDFNETIAIVRLCVNANRADLIENALFDRQSASDVRAMIGGMIESERTSRPAAATTPLFPGGPTPQQRDALAAALKKRFESMYGKSTA